MPKHFEVTVEAIHFIVRYYRPQSTVLQAVIEPNIQEFWTSLKVHKKTIIIFSNNDHVCTYASFIDKIDYNSHPRTISFFKEFLDNVFIDKHFIPHISALKK